MNNVLCNDKTDYTSLFSTLILIYIIYITDCRYFRLLHTNSIQYSTSFGKLIYTFNVNTILYEKYWSVYLHILNICSSRV